MLAGAVLAGCSDGSGAPPADLELAASCVLEADVDGAPTIALAYPEGWRLETCGRFDRDARATRDAVEGLVPADVTWTVVDETFEGAIDVLYDSPIEDLPSVQTTASTVVSGHQAARLVTERAGDGPWPEGTETTQWFVDLDPQGEATGSRPVLVGTVADIDGTDYAAAVDVLDEMARAIEISPRPDRSGVVVGRVEEGDVAWEVVAVDGCLRLRTLTAGAEVVDEDCDLGDDGLAASYLAGEDLPYVVLAGTAPDGADLIGFEDGSVAVAVPLPDGRGGFAIPAVGDEPATLVARSFGGATVSTAEVPALDSGNG